MPLVTLIGNKNTPSKEKTVKLIGFFDIVESIAEKHHLRLDSYNRLINTEVGECTIINFDHKKKTVEFAFATHSIYNGQTREKVTLALGKFIGFAHELARVTGYDIVIEKPLYYDE